MDREREKVKDRDKGADRNIQKRDVACLSLHSHPAFLRKGCPKADNTSGRPYKTLQ